MDMYNVLDTLKKIENPTEDQKAAIKSAEMTTPQAFPETQGVTEVSTTGDNLYAQYGKDAHADLIRLAEVPAQSDTTVDESIDVTEAQSPAQKAAFQKMLDAKKGKTEDKDEEVEEGNEFSGALAKAKGVWLTGKSISNIIPILLAVLIKPCRAFSNELPHHFMKRHVFQ